MADSKDDGKGRARPAIPPFRGAATTPRVPLRPTASGPQYGARLFAPRIQTGVKPTTISPDLSRPDSVVETSGIAADGELVDESGALPSIDELLDRDGGALSGPTEASRTADVPLGPATLGIPNCDLPVEGVAAPSATPGDIPRTMRAELFFTTPAPLSSPECVPAPTNGPEVVGERVDDLAQQLEEVARRVRAGELEVASYRVGGGEAAALAATLAALLAPVG